MKIVFWSNVHGQTGTTSNLLAIAIMCSIHIKSKCIVTQTHFNLNNLESFLVPYTDHMDKEYLMDVGIDALTRNIKTSPLDREIIENCTISFLNKQLNLLPGTAKINKEIYENDINRTITGILRAVEQYYDFVFIDTNSGKNDLTKRILDDADLIIVNLSQNKSMVEEYEMNYKFENKKVFYLIGNYDLNSRYTIKNMFKSYHWMKEKNTAVIPYNTEYMDALSDGQTIQYILKNMYCDKNDSNRFFIKEVKAAAEKIMKCVGGERR